MTAINTNSLAPHLQVEYTILTGQAQALRTPQARTAVRRFEKLHGLRDSNAQFLAKQIRYAGPGPRPGKRHRGTRLQALHG